MTNAYYHEGIDFLFNNTTGMNVTDTGTFIRVMLLPQSTYTFAASGLFTDVSALVEDPTHRSDRLQSPTVVSGVVDFADIVLSGAAASSESFSVVTYFDPDQAQTSNDEILISFHDDGPGFPITGLDGTDFPIETPNGAWGG